MDMPVRIWAFGSEHCGVWVSRNCQETEYTRTDTVADIIRERDEAVRREKALLESNDIERKALVEAASLRHQLKQANARISELESRQ